MKKIGIFLGFEYKAKIKAEGIGRLLGFMLKAQQQEIVVAMPEWLKKEFWELLDDQDIDRDKIELVTTQKVPYSLKAYEFLKKIREKKNRKRVSGIQKISEWVKKVLRDRINTLISSKSLLRIIATGLIFLIVGIILVPIALVLEICLLLRKYIKKVVKFLSKQGVRGVKKGIRTIYQVEIFEEIMQDLYARLHSVELTQLVDKINKRVDIPVWYIPTLFWPEVAEIKVKKVIAAPDIVYYDFPVQFATLSDEKVHDKLIKTINCADQIICYSDYVKYNHIVERFGLSEDKVTVIPHGCIEMNKLLKVKKSIVESITQRQLAIEEIEKYIWESGQTREIVKNIKWGQMRYVIYSSQLRPHKNMLTLIKAIEILNRRYYKNIKLIVTGNIAQNEDICKFVDEHNMHNEIIQFYNIPSKVLAALNKLAICAVNPTMFEGGFPFTFTEAYSMGTPSIMSNIEVVKEKIQDDQLAEKMLFNPYDVEELVSKLDWAIDNRDTLFSIESNLYQKFEARNWETVINEYMQLFDAM